MKTRVYVFLIVALWSLTTAVGAMPLFFTVDTVTDELVRIDASTGNTTVVGALGMDAVDHDLARTADGRLWGLNSVAGSRVDLWEISPLTGSVISSTQVLDVTGAAVLGAEGLGSNGNQLTIGYRAGGNISLSDTFANLSMAGVISAPVTVNFDIDGLSVGAGSTPYFAVDREPSLSSLLYQLDPPVGTVLGPVYDPNTFFFNDLMPAGDSLFVIDNGSPLIYRMTLATGVLQETVSLSRQGTYVGLANADPLVPVPEPTTIVLMSVGLAGIGYSRRQIRSA